LRPEAGRVALARPARPAALDVARRVGPAAARPRAMLGAPVRVSPCVVLLGLAVLVAGCSGAAKRSIADAQLPKLVLQPGDLPRAFSEFDAGRQVQLDRVPGPRF